MRKMLNRDVLGKIATLLLAIAIWYVIRHLTDQPPGRQPDAPASAQTVR
jgi:YbbR domain-containing protein